jgi:DNA-binding PadR family transcriptional regulator
MEIKQFIVSTDALDKRGKRLYQITAKGKNRFEELMKEPVKPGVHLDDIYTLKLEGIYSVDPQIGQSILDSFRAVKLAEREHYLDHLDKLKVLHEQSDFYSQSVDVTQLNINKTDVYLDWINQVEANYKENYAKFRQANTTRK